MIQIPNTLKKIAISIPIHEQPIVVADHLRNIRKFVPNSIVVLHASADGPNNFFNEIKELSISEFKDFAFVNDKQYHTFSPHDAGFVTGLSTVHASNFRYINSIVSDFDVFALETSNDMFVRNGAEILWNTFECGCGAIKDSVDDWQNNSHVQTMQKIIKLTTIEKHAQEGSFYPKDVFKEASNIILDKMGGFLDSEELIIHTLCYNLKPELYNNTVGESYVFHNYKDIATKINDILDVRNGVYTNKYVVKRVPRKIDDTTRIYINRLTKDD